MFRTNIIHLWSCIASLLNFSPAEYPTPLTRKSGNKLSLLSAFRKNNGPDKKSNLFARFAPDFNSNDLTDTIIKNARAASNNSFKNSAKKFFKKAQKWDEVGQTIKGKLTSERISDAERGMSNQQFSDRQTLIVNRSLEDLESQLDIEDTDKLQRIAMESYHMSIQTRCICSFYWEQYLRQNNIKIHRSTSQKRKVDLALGLGLVQKTANELNGSNHTVLTKNITAVKRSWVEAKKDEESMNGAKRQKIH